ncbi:hypothetical protein MGYG_03550 [Nannizzia gypsea CBS 118893]|uniref:F-box domain-containing protein n=1 Tax=Arthroderma gypseum (strain ATCC MYA-4604 / CBS 118893) TaxID=535722 RepID=E4USH9_ARTGP|nr:hypothetical protein MGYG_03550 [Nannizzia gypsea CBS 118893]EFR00546.1 hypothetical protein MGYG_03550 [Nannizzia gypsea CBS 118893]
MKLAKVRRLFQKFRSRRRPASHLPTEDEPTEDGPTEGEPAEDEPTKNEPTEDRQNSRFLTLPTELIEMIVSFLESEDLCSLRLTCNACYKRTQHSFGLLFTTLKTDFSDDSLNKLLAISQDLRLKHHPQTLKVTINYSRGRRRLGTGIPWERGPTGRLTVPQPPVQKLRDILIALVNCRSFEIWNNDGRDKALDLIQPSESLRIIFYIIAEAALPLKSLTLDYDGGHGIDEQYLDFQDLRKEGFLSSTSNLQSLTLQCYLSLKNVNWINEVARAATGLKTLTFSCPSDPTEYFLEHKCLSALERAPLQKIFLRGTDWPTPEHCIDFFRCYRSSLRTLHLHLNTLSSPGWSAVLEELRDNFPLLANIKLSTLREPGPQINIIDFYKLPEVSGCACVDFFSFDQIAVDQPAPKEYGSEFLYGLRDRADGRIVQAVKYSGPDMQSVLQHMINSARLSPLLIRWPAT